MGCSSCKNKREMPGSILNVPTPRSDIKPRNVVSNLVEAASSQSDKFKWFRDGITGIVKCWAGQTKYSDEEIVKNRNFCRECEYATKEDGKITTKSQCMAPDPTKNGEKCGCFIVCKTQSGKCPIDKFTYITNSIRKDQPLQDNKTNVDI